MREAVCKVLLEGNMLVIDLSDESEREILKISKKTGVSLKVLFGSFVDNYIKEQSKKNEGKKRRERIKAWKEFSAEILNSGEILDEEPDRINFRMPEEMDDLRP